jgi:hypothetical protein
MQIGVHDVFFIKFFSFTCYDTVSYYDTMHYGCSIINRDGGSTTLISHLINWCATLDFCQHDMHDTTYDTSIVASNSRYNKII